MIDWLLIFISVFSPLVGGGLSLMFKERSANLSVVFLAISFFSSLILLIIGHMITWRGEWLNSLEIGINVDTTSNLLLVLVSFVSLLVHLFSGTYMESDAGKPRYFAMLGFFTFSMLGLLIAADLILLFIFWELVGLASYLLIGFWYRKEGIPPSARLAFMTNRIADVALLIGIIMVGASNETMIISDLDGTTLAVLPGFLIAIGAFGKSAQLPFSGWLTKAMVGPTPVSALIHAATMVAAGVYLLFRVAPYLPEQVLTFIAVIGVSTTLYGALSAIIQNDIKKVLAYSTISQLGYMITGIGVGAADASLFHLWTHAFFKAGLFLGAGSIIHYLHLAAGHDEAFDAQDMRSMGGIKEKLPWTFRSFVVCGLALAGIPFFSGFLSKEGIILASWAWADDLGTMAYLVPDTLFITALATAFYVARMIVLVFFGDSRLGEQLKAFSYRESWRLTVPLMLLAFGSLWFIYQVNPFGHRPYLFDLMAVEQTENDPFISSYTLFLSLVLSAGGVLMGYFLFRPGTAFSNAYKDSQPIATLTGRMLYHGFFLVTVYESFGKGVLYLARRAHAMDTKIIDTTLHFIGVGTVVLAKGLAIFDRFVIDGLVNFLAWVSGVFGRLFSGLHPRGSQMQLLWLILLIILILVWILLF